MFFDFLFGKKSSSATAQPSAVAPAQLTDHASVINDTPRMAPGTRIAYSPTLVAQLKADHQHLLATYTAIGDAFAQGDLHTTRDLLQTLRSDLQSHLLTENVRFYIYLDHSLGNEPEQRALVRQFRHEMDDIGKAALAFLMRYANIDRETDGRDQFASELIGIGRVLSQRIQSEEARLYPLYQPV